ncbi:MAG: Fe-S cluster assembly protein SufD [Hahellaceae bacterium]|nr:Fe-S cluster assembly protein SufD [Hahellaceae bacterium]
MTIATPHPYETLKQWLLGKAREQLKTTDAPDWLKGQRLAALDVFANATLPTRKTENWRYTPIVSLNSLSQAAAGDETRSPTESLPELSAGPSPTFTFIDGVLSTTPESVAGLTWTRFSEASDAQQLHITAALQSLPPQHPFLALNAGWSGEGLLLEVAPEATLPLIQIHYLAQTAQALSLPRIVVRAGRHSRFELLEVFASSPRADGTGLTNHAIQFQLANSAQCVHTVVNHEAPEQRHIGFVQATLQGHSRYEHHAFARGSALCRRDIQVDLSEPAAETRLNGVYLLNGSRHCDFHTCINHQAPHCNSEEAFRGIIGDTARAVFNGRIHIYRDAQKSNAQMSNNNLLLTSRAEVNTKPELEIYADDVKCSHGATVGQLDKQALYYCQSRGIPYEMACQLLSHAFVNELLESVPNGEIATWLEALAEPFYREAKPA